MTIIDIAYKIMKEDIFMWMLYAVVARVLGIACVALLIAGIAIKSKAKKTENPDAKGKAKKLFIAAAVLGVAAVLCFLTCLIPTGEGINLEDGANTAISNYYNK